MGRQINNKTYSSDVNDADLEDLERQVRNSITRFLARREHSCLELKRKLAQKGFLEPMVSDTISLFTAKGLQSDHRYAEVFVRSCYQKGKGPAYIEQSLQQQDIDGELVKELLSNCAFDWFEAAYKAREKRFGENLPKNFNDIQKQKRFLQYRGFYQAHINEVFN